MLMLGADGGWSSEVHSPTSTEVRSPTSTSTEVRSPTSTSTEVRSPTSTSTDAYTQGNVTVTGGAGAGATTSVNIYRSAPKKHRRADAKQHQARSAGSATRMQNMIQATSAPRAPSPMPAIMYETGSDRPQPVFGAAPSVWDQTKTAAGDVATVVEWSTDDAAAIIGVKTAWLAAILLSVKFVTIGLWMELKKR